MAAVLGTQSEEAPRPLVAAVTMEPGGILDVLARAGVPFVVIGGHAVNFHGYVRTTEDADIVFFRSPESEARLLKALESVNARWISDDIDPSTDIERQVPVSAAYVMANHLMMLTTDAGFVDIYDYIPGFPEVSPQDLLADSVPMGDLRFVSLQWLRRLKERAARHKDLDDLENLPPA